MGCETSETNFFAPAHGLWTLDNRVAPDKLCKLCSNRTPHEAIADSSLLQWIISNIVIDWHIESETCNRFHTS